MSKVVSFTEKEIQSLLSTAFEWCDMMGSGEDTAKLVDERLECEGLGSALEKLSRGRICHHMYEEYKRGNN